ncbi:carbohydrate ABC transporter permease [Agromyces sp. SYSU K20354]|uniref:carbohydrate ABC transporter permease n=1 Tax=Agromyces cavernae TaxID=2898659 RepID=UPI001E5B6525|nr:carbohydrate ABC transporter permease [Agromyces cavernae]MCD2443377.1 carbohydrate ABC transporter permease [Agromyces cavernae]
MSAAVRVSRTRRRSRLASAVLTLVIFVGFILMAAPFYWLVVGSTLTSSEVFSNPPHLLPGDQLVANWVNLFGERGYLRPVLNSIAISIVYVIVGMVICLCGGYAFAKFQFRGKAFLFGFVIATLAIPSQVTLVPLFQTMVALGWLNSYQALILPGLAFPFGLFLMRQAMQSVPDELIQAARIDGAGEFRILFQIVSPALRPALAALGIFLFLAIWNDFIWPLVVLRSEDAYTIPVALASFSDGNTTDYGQLILATTISVIPVALLFIFMQRYFVSGLLGGAVKQ